MPSRIHCFDILRVVAILFVMYIHSPIEEAVAGSSTVWLVERYLGSGAVPAFFLLSGYLARRKLNDVSVGFVEYFREKWRTLIIPFLAWNAIILGLVVVVRLLAGPATSQDGGYLGTNFDLSSLLCALLGIGRQPIAYQLWFLRDLIIVSLVCFSLRKYISLIPLLGWLLLVVPLPLASSFGLYIIGYRLSFLVGQDHFPENFGSLTYCVIWLLLGIASSQSLLVMPAVVMWLGSAAFLFFLAHGLSSTPVGPRLAAMASSVFFVYATHEPLQTIIGRLWSAVGVGRGAIAFFITPLIAFPLCVAAYGVLKKRIPAIIAFLTGGR